jgi:hypothetical protein
VRIWVQWADPPDSDFEPYEIRSQRDAKDLAALGRYITAVNVQGVIFEGIDHVAFQKVGQALIVHAWTDPDDGTPAQQWTFLPPAPDPAIGGLVNTRQTLVQFDGKGGNPKREDFTPPGQEVRLDGTWLTDRQFATAQRKRTMHGWEEWK